MERIKRKEVKDKKNAMKKKIKTYLMKNKVKLETYSNITISNTEDKQTALKVVNKKLYPGKWSKVKTVKLKKRR